MSSSDHCLDRRLYRGSARCDRAPHLLTSSISVTFQSVIMRLEMPSSGLRVRHSTISEHAAGAIQERSATLRRVHG